MRTLCFKMDAELFKELKIQVAKSGKTLQDYMKDLIESDLYPFEKDENTAEQISQIRIQLKESMERLDEVLASHEAAFREINQEESDDEETATFQTM